MKMEIEKKFLLRELPANLEQYEYKIIEQGYLCVNPVVRIRRANDDYILTYKSKLRPGEAERDTVRVNQEVEVPLNRSGYEHLREKVDGRLIEKKRYLIPLPDGHIGELDVFEGVLRGLVFIEVEFEDERDAAAFAAPDWFGKNVSGDYHFSNSYLSTCRDLSDFCNIGI